MSFLLTGNFPFDLTVNGLRLGRGGSAGIPQLNNAVFGYQALNGLGTGLNNVAIGAAAAYSLTDGNNNVAVGWFSQVAVTTGKFNTAVGSEACKGNTDYNTGIGANALKTATGSGNTALGIDAGLAVTSGSNNCIVKSSGSPCFVVTTENDRVVIGTSAVTDAYVQVAWTYTSDGRDKTNIQPLDRGVAFLCQLRPVTYQFRSDRNSDEAVGRRRAGFIAQEIAALEDDALVIDRDDPEKLRINSDALVPILVRAIQELSERIEALERGSRTP